MQPIDNPSSVFKFTDPLTLFEEQASLQLHHLLHEAFSFERTESVGQAPSLKKRVWSHKKASDQDNGSRAPFKIAYNDLKQPHISLQANDSQQQFDSAAFSLFLDQLSQGPTFKIDLSHASKEQLELFLNHEAARCASEMNMDLTYTPLYPKDIAKILKNKQELQALEQQMSQLADGHAEAIFGRSYTLISQGYQRNIKLLLNAQKKESFASISHPTHNYFQLEAMSLTSAHYVPDSLFVMELLTRAPNLKKLTIGQIDPSLLNSMLTSAPPALSSLTLDLGGQHYPGNLNRLIGQTFSQLKEVTVILNQDLKESDHLLYQNNPHLERVCLSGLSLSPDSYSLFKDSKEPLCPVLESLEIDLIDLKTAHLPLLKKNCPQLKELCLYLSIPDVNYRPPNREHFQSLWPNFQLAIYLPRGIEASSAE
ncbi:MAG: hypothetical protein K0S07_989 [Chlamydiales bacterium]|jgi:hypothetical protein|nr:hypothetical protein [Chlamydiales bacterium]